ncbi:MAG TPA: Na+/H+ antiporter NhaA [Fibrobacteria bacterium]|nr:Na+/H+ antiporter NhaA [Fibrobacteria bacterium]
MARQNGSREGTQHRNRTALLWQPFADFFQTSSASGVTLIFCMVLAMAWANSPWRHGYHLFHVLDIEFRLGGAGVSKSLAHWINDGLMAVFFLLVGLEIKREVLAGELARLKQAALPIAGAVGGMLVPALIYSAFNRGGPAAAGWGIPMATDIAFALGVLSLLGNRVPMGLKVFLAALAIIDDLGAVLVIAFFYTSAIDWAALGAAAVLVLALVTMGRAGVRRSGPFLLVGLFLWAAFLRSGVHATIAGVVLAFCIPARSRLPEDAFPGLVDSILARFKSASGKAWTPILNEERVDAIHDLERAAEDVEPTLQRLERHLHPYVSFVILPLFAVANAGVEVHPATVASLLEPVGLGVSLGLLLGKPVGILLFSWLAVAARLGELPAGVRWSGMVGCAILGGIGFTMSIFIAGLGLGEGALLDQAKLAILCASTLSGLLGWAYLRLTTAPVARSLASGAAE